MSRPSSPTTAPELPPFEGPRPGALSLLTPAQRGLALAIMQADRNGRGGADLDILGSRFSHATDPTSQLTQRLKMLEKYSSAPRR